MAFLINIGDQVQLDCSAASKALPSLKSRLDGRVGVIVSHESEFGQNMPYNYTVAFPRFGRKSAIEVELHVSVLVKAQQ